MVLLDAKTGCFKNSFKHVLRAIKSFAFNQDMLLTSVHQGESCGREYKKCKLADGLRETATFFFANI
jgi:hypothetical protein